MNQISVRTIVDEAPIVAIVRRPKLLKRLRGRFTPKNSAFWRRVEKVGLIWKTPLNSSNLESMLWDLAAD
jgi:hypothetical protein